MPGLSSLMLPSCAKRRLFLWLVSKMEIFPIGSQVDRNLSLIKLLLVPCTEMFLVYTQMPDFPRLPTTMKMHCLVESAPHFGPCLTESLLFLRPARAQRSLGFPEPPPRATSTPSCANPASARETRRKAALGRGLRSHPAQLYVPCRLTPQTDSPFRSYPPRQP